MVVVVSSEFMKFLNSLSEKKLINEPFIDVDLVYKELDYDSQFT